MFHVSAARRLGRQRRGDQAVAGSERACEDCNAVRHRGFLVARERSRFVGDTPVLLDGTKGHATTAIPAAVATAGETWLRRYVGPDTTDRTLFRDVGPPEPYSFRSRTASLNSAPSPGGNALGIGQDRFESVGRHIPVFAVKWHVLDLLAWRRVLPVRQDP